MWSSACAPAPITVRVSQSSRARHWAASAEFRRRLHPGEVLPVEDGERVAVRPSNRMTIDWMFGQVAVGIAWKDQARLDRHSLLPAPSTPDQQVVPRPRLGHQQPLDVWRSPRRVAPAQGIDKNQRIDARGESVGVDKR